MTTLATGSSVSLTLANNGFLEVATGGGFGSVTITPTSGAAVTESWGPGPFRKRWNGPYPEGATVSLANASSAALDYETDSSSLPPAVQALVSNAWIQTTDGGIHTLSEVQAVVSATVSGTVLTGACLFRGLVVRAIVGTPQTATVYDALSATGTPIATFTLAALGTYYWDGDQVTVGNGRGGRRQNATGLHIVFSGGTSRTVDVMVEVA